MANRRLPIVPREGPAAPSSTGAGFIFLSYAAEDVRIARQLAEHLESRGWSVWWDRKIPAGHTFDEAIEEALQLAGCVIVLWTNASVASRWVRSEASEALRRDILVPVLVDDVRIPLEFRLVQAIDLREWGGGLPEVSALAPLHDAIARIAVDLPSVDPAVDREERHAGHASVGRRSRLATPLVLLAVILGLVAAGGGWYWEAFHREQIEYFANVTTRWGFPEGIGRLTADVVRRRNATVAVIRHGRRNPADEIRVVNSAGNLPPLGIGAVGLMSVSGLNPLANSGANDATGSGALFSELLQVVRLTFSRDARGQILEQAAFTRGGRRIYTIHFAQPDIGEYKRQGFGTPVRESGIRYLRFSRVPNGPHAGRIETVMCLDDKQQPQPDEDGAYGYRAVFDGAGHEIERIHLGADGKDAPDKRGILKSINSYDDRGNLVESSPVDAHGALVATRVGSAAARLEYDDVGNVVRLSQLDTKRQLVTSRFLGAASVNYSYDRAGRLTSMVFFGPDDKPVADGQLGAAKVTIEWPSAVRSVFRFYDVNERPMPGLEGSFETVQVWDSNGNPTEASYRDDKGQATRTQQGCATVRFQYDDVGNIAELRCLNEHAAEILDIGGSSTIRVTYDALGNRLSSTFYGPQGAPGRVGERYASIRWTYNVFGKIEREAYFDARGVPVRSRLGLAATTYEYDTGGNQIAERYWDEDSKRIASVEHISAIQKKFDARGRQVEAAYLDASDRPVRSTNGYAMVRNEFDDRGYIVKQQVFGEDGRPTKTVDGYSALRYKRNAAGQRLEVEYFDERLAPCVTRFGVARRRFTYDAAGREIERSEYDAAGRPLINAFGYAILRRLYDDHGRETGRELLDPERKTLPFVVAIYSVSPGSVAADVGLKAGDALLTYDGEAVRTSDTFTNTLERFKGDRGRELRIQRTGQVLSLDLPPGRVHGLELVERVLDARPIQ